MPRPNPATSGTTKMIIDAIFVDEAMNDGGELQEDDVAQILDNISIDEFLRGLIADSDIEEVQAVLDMIKDEGQV